jgi:hypothetical protein
MGYISTKIYESFLVVVSTSSMIEKSPTASATIWGGAAINLSLGG